MNEQKTKMNEDLKNAYRSRKGKILDLGCGNNKIPNSFGVDINPLVADLIWDLEKRLPKKFWNEFDIVSHICVLDHLGNPLNFLKNCNLYLKKGGKTEFVIDNASYWRANRKEFPFSQYHSTAWMQNDKLGHKMLFQKEHTERLLRLAGFEKIEIKFFFRTKVDWLLPKVYGCMLMKVVAKKSKKKTLRIKPEGGKRG